MKNLLKALFSSWMWVAFMHGLVRGEVSTFMYWFYLIAGCVFFNILFQFQDLEE